MSDAKKALDLLAAHKVPCGVCMGHGAYCQPNNLCRICRMVSAALPTLQALVEENERLREALEDAKDNPRDEYHTMRELYDYRMLYNAHAARSWAKDGRAVKSWRHSDGDLCFGGGWFVVVATLESGQVTNHYEASAWNLFDVPEVRVAPVWDGHTPAIAADRLRAALSGEAPKEGGDG